jgi:uncharacterized protein YndB with AHSA1/START domain
MAPEKIMMTFEGNVSMDLFFREFYPHPIGKVWAALTDPVALAAWLMENDFEPIIGKRFSFRPQPVGGGRGLIECEVLALEPPARMVWSWQSTETDPPGRVEINLKAVEGGTELTLAHTGETDPERRAQYASGWAGKFAQLHKQLSSS